MEKKQIVIIPVHNQLPYVKKCVKSIQKHSPEAIMMVVDDGSTDEVTSQWIQDNQDLFVVITNETALGFTGACNRAIDFAMFNYDFTCLCLLNSDAEVVTPDWFSKVENHFIIGENIGIAGVVSNNAMAQTIHNVPKYMESIDKKPTIYLEFVHGFCYFISKKLIDKIGRLDGHTFPHYGSEDDYSLKALKYGFKNIVVGSVMVFHNNETSYSHKVRAEYIKKTMPMLMKRWNAYYVDSCVRHANLANKYLNE